MIKTLKKLFFIRLDPKETSLYKELLDRGYDVNNLNITDLNYDSIWLKIYTKFNKYKYSFLCKIAKEQIEDAVLDAKNEEWRRCQKEIEEAYMLGFNDGQNNRV